MRLSQRGKGWLLGAAFSLGCWFALGYSAYLVLR
jgi:hypothetical protein